MGIETTKTIATITPSHPPSYVKSTTTIEEATTYAVEMLKKKGVLQLEISEITRKYFFSHWNDKEKIAFICFSNLDEIIVEKIRQTAEEQGIFFSETHLPMPIEIQTNGLVRGFSPIHFSVKTKA